MDRFAIFLATTALLAASGAPLGAQELRPLAVEDAIRIRSFFQTPPAFSPDGKLLAFTVTDNGDGSRPAMETGATRMPATDIYSSNVETGETSRLTGGQGSNWLPVWSPDGRFLAFVSTRGGSGRQLWVWDTMKDAIRIVASIEVRGDQIEWTPDSRSIAVAARREKSGDKAVVGPRFRPRPEQGEKTASGPTVRIYQSDAGPVPISEPWSLENDRCDLVLVDIVTGKITPIASAQRVSKYLLSPDGSVVAYTDPVEFEEPGSQQILFDLVTISLAAKQRRVVAVNIRLDHDGAQFSWSPDGRQLTYQAGGVLEKNHDCYLVDARVGGTRDVTELPRHDFSYKTVAPLWDPRGKRIYFIRDGGVWQAPAEQGKASEVVRIPGYRTVQLASKGANELWMALDGKSTVVVAHSIEQKQDGFYRIDLTTGETTRLLEQGQCYTCAMRGEHLTVSQDGQRFAYFSEDARHDADLWVSNASLLNPRRVTHLNPRFDHYQMGDSTSIEWLSDDGESLRGALLLPPAYQPGRRYPVIVWVYGGATLSDNLHHFGLAYSGVFNMQLLATRGYAVLLPDAPLGAGRPMLDLAKTIIPGLNRLIEMGIADPDRLGIIGHSYGGYSTLALITQTRRFRAAIEVDGFADLMALYGEMDQQGASFGVALQEHGSMEGTPWQSRQRYIENSPIFYLDMVDTPLLVMQGTEDETVGSFLADEIFVGLRRLGKEVQYAKYRGEGHSPLNWSYLNQKDLCERVIVWFDGHLQARTTANAGHSQ